MVLAREPMIFIG
jgi:hypothetical protein